MTHPAPASCYARFAHPGLHRVGGASPEEAQAHVVFVHGLKGNAYATWSRQKNDPQTYWPAWVAEDLADHGVAVWAYGYDASPTVFKGKPEALEPTAMTFLQHLEAQGLSGQPVALVAHSLGGLVSKAMLRKLHDTKHAHWAAFRGLVFFGTPHLGAPVKSALTPLDALASPLAEVLDFSHPTLLGLNDWFRHHWTGQQTLTYTETQPLALGVTIVPQASADPALPHALCYTLPANHLDMCKLDGRDALVYQHVCQFLKNTLLTPTPNADPPVPAASPTVAHFANIPASQPEHFISLPTSIGPRFVGRGQDLQVLHQALHAEGRALGVTASVLHGLGGQGKTRMAVEYARQHAGSYRSILFLDASSPESWRDALAQAAHRLGLQNVPSDNPKQQAEATSGWLAAHSGWLLIADNADTEQAAQAVASLVERCPEGHVIVTSRRADWPAPFLTLPLTRLIDDEARALLLDRAGSRSTSLNEPESTALDELVRELQGLPLALVHAAAVMDERRWGFFRYAQHLRGSPVDLLRFEPTGLLNDYGRSILACIQDSLTHLQERDPPAFQLLRCLSQMAPAPVPGPLFEVPLVGIEDLYRARTALLRLHLLEDLGAEGQEGLRCYQVHRLVRAVVSLSGVKNIGEALAARADTALPWTMAVAWVEAAFNVPPEPRSAVVMALLPHAVALLNAVEQMDAQSFADHPFAGTYLGLSRRMARWARLTDRFPLAEALSRQALVIKETRLGRHHLEVAADLNDLGVVLMSAGPVRGAEALFRRALAIAESHGPQAHAVLLIYLNSWGEALKALGQLDHAETVFRRAHALCLQTQDANPESLAAVACNLAQLLRCTHRLPEAESLYRSALPVLEKNRPLSAVHCLVGLAVVLGESAERLDEAERTCQQALDLAWANGASLTVLTMCWNVQAGLLEKKGGSEHLAEAEILYRRVLPCDEISYGVCHPKVAGDLNNLACLLMSTHQWPEARDLFERALTIWVAQSACERVVLPGLPECLANYKVGMQAVGCQPAEVAQTCERLLAPLPPTLRDTFPP